MQIRNIITCENQGNNIATCCENQRNNITCENQGNNIAICCKNEGNNITSENQGSNIATCKIQGNNITSENQGSNIATCCKIQGNNITCENQGCALTGELISIYTCIYTASTFRFYYIIILPFIREMRADIYGIHHCAVSFTGVKTGLHLPVDIYMYVILYMVL